MGEARTLICRGVRWGAAIAAVIVGAGAAAWSVVESYRQPTVRLVEDDHS